MIKATLKKDFLIRNIAGENVLIGCGEQVNFSKMLILNDTATSLVSKLQQKNGATSEELAQHLTEEYNVWKHRLTRISADNHFLSYLYIQRKCTNPYRAKYKSSKIKPQHRITPLCYRSVMRDENKGFPCAILLQILQQP